VICVSRSGSKSDLLQRRPELKGRDGEVISLPVYPSTWMTVKLEPHGEIAKVRSTNLEVCNGGTRSLPVQTERLRRSLTFHTLSPGCKVRILHHTRYKPRPPLAFPVTATIIAESNAEPKKPKRYVQAVSLL
jgi:hypothetical protein